MDKHKVRKTVRVLQGLLTLAEDFVEPEYEGVSRRCISGSTTDNNGCTMIVAPVSGYLVQVTVGDLDTGMDTARLTVCCGTVEDKYTARGRTLRGWTVTPFDFRVKKGASVYVVVEEGEAVAKAKVPVTLVFVEED